ncbi:hypothetical protein TWF718_001535 [Orbilia javanica]|uniref:Uncharacterized protein n=1 Tax=Orbilia javanica TaxID=47235 RepID=A0AAN8RSJ6_9PEZI
MSTQKPTCPPPHAATTFKQIGKKSTSDATETFRQKGRVAAALPPFIESDGITTYYAPSTHESFKTDKNPTYGNLHVTGNPIWSPTNNLPEKIDEPERIQESTASPSLLQDQNLIVVSSESPTCSKRDSFSILSLFPPPPVQRRPSTFAQIEQMVGIDHMGVPTTWTQSPKSQLPVSKDDKEERALSRQSTWSQYVTEEYRGDSEDGEGLEPAYMVT